MSLGNIRIRDLIVDARSRKASDVHFGGLDRPAMRIDGKLLLMSIPEIPAADVMAFLQSALAPQQLERLQAHGAADGAARRDEAGAPFRIHAYRHAGGIRVAVRLLAQDIPALDSLGVAASLTAFGSLANGLVMFAGPTGSGKTTVLASLIDHINRTSARVIVTIEDPVEYLHAAQGSCITQCEVGRDVGDFAEALRGVMRADPDIICIGEMRDRATMEAALTAAETGHLVLATIHTSDAAQTVDRIIDAFPADAHAQVRAQLASTLAGVAALRLVPRIRGRGRLPAAEILLRSDAVRALIRDGKTHQIRNVLVTGRAAGMQTLEANLSDLVMRGEISIADARSAACRPHEVNDSPVRAIS